MNKTLVFNDVEVNKNDFYDTKRAIPLNLVNVKNIVVKNNMIKANILLVIYMIFMQLVHCVSFVYHCVSFVYHCVSFV